MKILVLGSAGMAGHLITVYMKEMGYDVTGFARRPCNYCKTIIGDANNISQLLEILNQEMYDVVINCIGVLNQKVDEQLSTGIYLNSYLPHKISEILKNMKTKLIHLSTDCVFAGNTGPYTEHSVCDGQSYYDRTKALGEIIDAKNLTFRMSIIGPDINETGIGLFHWFMKQESDIKGYTNAIWTGVTTLTLAKAMDQAIKENINGLYHLVNNQTISKYDLCNLFNEYFRNGQIKITPYAGITLDKTLKNTRTDFHFNVPTYHQMLSEMKEWMECHKDLYAHYKM